MLVEALKTYQQRRAPYTILADVRAHRGKARGKRRLRPYVFAIVVTAFLGDASSDFARAALLTTRAYDTTEPHADER